MEKGLRDLLAVVDGYSEEAMRGPVDDQGWNVRDHLTHLAVWADGIAALLRRESRWEAMGLGIAEPEAEPDYDLLNAALVVQHRHLTAVGARAWVIEAHTRVSAAMDGLTDAELGMPYDRFVAPFTGDEGRPISEYILGNTEDHYDEHTPWIRELATTRDERWNS